VDELSTSTLLWATLSVLTSLEYNSGKDLEFLDFKAWKNGDTELDRLTITPEFDDMVLYYKQQNI